MALISMREFARRNGVSVEAISRAVKAGRLPQVEGKIDPGKAQPVWDEVRDRARAGRKIGRRGCQLAQVDTPEPQVDTLKPQVDTPKSQVDTRHGQVDTLRPQVDTQVDTQVDSQEEQVDTQVDTSGCQLAQVDTEPPQVDTGRPVAFRRSSRRPEPGIAVGIQLNGAEYMDLLKQAGDVNLSLPAFVLVRCGVETWREEAARTRPAPPMRSRPVRLALERRSVTVPLTGEAHDQLVAEARQAGLRLAQYMRVRCGLLARETSLPGTDERGDEEDDAWERLKRLGLDPQEYFPPET